jgi:hypothetical protein
MDVCRGCDVAVAVERTLKAVVEEVQAACCKGRELQMSAVQGSFVLSLECLAG